ncbi:MAG TPA: thioredoxin-dependent thiol peroxidase [Anaerolineaceae bacterium]|nr:thioredoxin-dependent thiol peroxidase [Anaerolineaceae bacterium]HPN50610.1 thioredoxin-dependent thiol peroxidase [Anaerolineaceae bacterium]
MPIKAGSLAPDFELADDSGQVRKLSDFRGQTVILYFYPKDDTPGCTTEACSFRDNYSAFLNAGAAVLGVSPDKVKSHLKFKDKFSLPFPLLADETHQVCELYGVWGEKKMMGKTYNGVYRTTFLIGPDGVIRKVYENVKPAEHIAEILADLA